MRKRRVFKTNKRDKSSLSEDKNNNSPKQEEHSIHKAQNTPNINSLLSSDNKERDEEEDINYCFICWIIRYYGFGYSVYRQDS